MHIVRQSKALVLGPWILLADDGFSCYRSPVMNSGSSHSSYYLLPLPFSPLKYFKQYLRDTSAPSQDTKFLALFFHKFTNSRKTIAYDKQCILIYELGFTMEMEGT